jgi:hypothetical protein
MGVMQKEWSAIQAAQPSTSTQMLVMENIYLSNLDIRVFIIKVIINQYDI